MDLATVLGLVAGTAVVGLAILFGGSASMFVNIPSMLIVLGGTIAATLTRFPLSEVMNALKLGTSNAFQQGTESSVGLIDEAVELAELSRTKGQLALENAPIDNEFLRKGALMYCDGLQPEFIGHALSRDRDLLIERLEEGEKIYRIHGRCRSGVRNDRNPCRTGANVEYHGRSRNHWSVHGGCPSDDSLWGAGCQPHCAANC